MDDEKTIMKPFVLLAVCVACVSGELKIVDMSHKIDQSTVFWPGNPDYNFTIQFRNYTAGGWWYEANYFQTAEHGGTHMDSPVHFSKGSWRTAQIPLEKLMGPGVIINVTEKASTNPDYRVMVSDLEEWEAKHGKIPPKAVVIMNSGWHYKYPNKTQVFSTAEPNNPSTFHFPAWHEDAAKWLVEKRNINVLGVDTPSTDYGQSKTFPVHVILGSNQVPGAENAANLDNVPEHGAMVYLPVIKLFDGSGGPVRIFATYDDALVIGSASRFSISLSVTLLLSFVSFFCI